MPGQIPLAIPVQDCLTHYVIEATHGNSVEIAILVTLTGGHNECLPQQVAEDVLVNLFQGNGTKVNY